MDSRSRKQKPEVREARSIVRHLADQDKSKERSDQNQEVMTNEVGAKEDMENTDKLQ